MPCKIWSLFFEWRARKRIENWNLIYVHIVTFQNPGHLKISPGGILWKKQGGGKAVEVDRADILGVTWMKVPRTNQLSVLIKGGPWYKFTGFRDQVFLQCP
jgi:hypothetical protein